MSFQYSKKLIDETIQCFKEENGLDISPEKANEYLDSLGGLYLVFAKRHRSSSASKEAEVSVLVDESPNTSLGVSNT